MTPKLCDTRKIQFPPFYLSAAGFSGTKPARMNIRSFLLISSTSLLLAVVAGCNRPDISEQAAPPIYVPPPASPDTVARVHWLGKYRLAISASAYYVMRLWQLPETRKVQEQTVEKLATAPWRLAQGEAAVKKAPIALLQSLFDDVIEDESYFEIRHTTNHQSETAFAIRLNDARAGVWRTNLVAVVASLTGVQNMTILDKGQGWALDQPKPPRRFQLQRIGDWTVFAVGPHTNELLQAIEQSIRHPRPHVPRDPENWIEADFDLGRIISTSNPLVGDDLPTVSLAITGDGGNVLEHATFTFPKSLSLDLEPWNVPKNLIQGKLTSISAIRGIAPLLKNSSFWKDVKLGAPPDQIYSWGLESNAFRTYIAAAVPNASNQVQGLTKRLLENGNPWLTAHGYVNFEPLQNFNGAIWGNLPNVRPFFSSEDGGAGGMIYGGLFPDTGESAFTPPEDWIRPVSQETNLVVCNWEATGERVHEAFDISQLVRLLFRRPLLPADSASAVWLKAAAPRLGDCDTRVTLTGADQLTFDRKSTVGFSAAELNLVADWLESPDFPHGLHTTVAKPQQTGDSAQR